MIGTMMVLVGVSLMVLALPSMTTGISIKIIGIISVLTAMP